MVRGHGAADAGDLGVGHQGAGHPGGDVHRRLRGGHLHRLYVPCTLPFIRG